MLRGTRPGFRIPGPVRAWIQRWWGSRAGKPAGLGSRAAEAVAPPPDSQRACRTVGLRHVIVLQQVEKHAAPQLHDGAYRPVAEPGSFRYHRYGLAKVSAQRRHVVFSRVPGFSPSTNRVAVVSRDPVTFIAQPFKLLFGRAVRLAGSAPAMSRGRCASTGCAAVAARRPSASEPRAPGVNFLKGEPRNRPETQAPWPQWEATAPGLF
jgi:hypothetical protein